MKRKIIVLVLPILFIITALFASNFFLKYISVKLPPCLFNSATGYYCPGCGNTRSLDALLHGDILTSLRYNPFIILLIIYFICLYIELFSATFFKKIKIIPRSNKFIFTALGIIIAYYIARNFIPFLMLP